jgi:hypothetical protein
METGVKHIEVDHMQIRQFIAATWQTLFEATSKINGPMRSVLNPHFGVIMNGMLNCLFSEEGLVNGTILPLSNSVNTVLETCDNEHLKSELFATCEYIYNKINEFITS